MVERADCSQPCTKICARATHLTQRSGPSTLDRTLMDRGRVLAASKTRERAYHQAQVAQAAHAAACQTVLHVLPGSDNLLGPMASVARVHFLEGMGHFKHGCAQRCPSTRVPLCLVNPEAPDVKYVVCFPTPLLPRNAPLSSPQFARAM
jgi:hypothetical protein